MHASSSRLITIKPFGAAAQTTSIRLAPALEQKRQARLGGAAPSSQPQPGLSKDAQALRSDVASKLLLQRQSAVRSAAITALREESSITSSDRPAAVDGSSAAALASTWPSNLRIEPEINKRDLYWKVPSEQREQLRKMLKETRK
ncbi:hypothetical protein OC845_005484 [Tilletia horrida]|nr:hypothetical protein OC845_005484 [Tilletia horrida]